MKRKIASILAAALIATPVLSANLSTANAAYTPYSITSVSNTVNLAKYDDGILIDHVVYYPKDMTASNKKYPVVVWGNGTFGNWNNYKELLSQIAAGGYIVVANNDSFCGSGVTESASVNFIINEGKDKNSMFYNKVDAEHVGAGGHSQGGMSAVNSSRLNSKIDCVFDVQGCQLQSEASKLKVPTFFVTSTQDSIVSSSWVKNSYNACNVPAVYASVKNVTHFGPVDGNQASIFAEYAVKWFDAFLKNDSSAKAAFLNGGKLSKDSRWVNYTSKNF
ncbi:MULTISPECIES: dienelactone hydrolase family protein [Ruminococcus]|uniref:Dienelactone hydrolase n=1 Tax=Ruminococcus flavefaciens TaxID=1265 RepID=A0A1M7JJ89_RUMFL|nr:MULTISPECIES: dienelactone hydrolase family protein [Ruminococcus]MCR4794574.1 dienelactone hydrolase family protein [Ruminococcus sp.]SHM53074.1 Dienelactone hydrolase [Ruminococcus flavefaciens]